MCTMHESNLAHCMAGLNILGLIAHIFVYTICEFYCKVDIRSETLVQMSLVTAQIN